MKRAILLRPKTTEICAKIFLVFLKSKTKTYVLKTNVKEIIRGKNMKI